MWGIALLVFREVLEAALIVTVVAAATSGVGQELFNACVLFAAVLMIGWHVIWMSSHGRELAQHMKAVGGAVQTGASSLTLLLAVVALAVLREGSEIVLFLYGMVAGGADGLVPRSEE